MTAAYLKTVLFASSLIAVELEANGWSVISVTHWNQRWWFLSRKTIWKEIQNESSKLAQIGKHGLICYEWDNILYLILLFFHSYQDSLCKTRVRVESTIGGWKNKFQILKMQSHLQPERVCKVQLFLCYFYAFHESSHIGVLSAYQFYGFWILVGHHSHGCALEHWDSVGRHCWLRSRCSHGSIEWVIWPWKCQYNTDWCVATK